MSRCMHLARWPIASIILLIATISSDFGHPPGEALSSTTNVVLLEAESNKKFTPLEATLFNAPRAVIAIKVVELIDGNSPPIASHTSLTMVTDKDSALRLFAAPPCCYILFCLSWIAYLSAIG